MGRNSLSIVLSPLKRHFRVFQIFSGGLIFVFQVHQKVHQKGAFLCFDLLLLFGENGSTGVIPKGDTCKTKQMKVSLCIFIEGVYWQKPYQNLILDTFQTDTPCTYLKKKHKIRVL